MTQIPVDKAQELLAAWVDEVIMPKSTPVQKAMITLALLQRGPDLASMLQPLADSKGFINSDNLIAALDKAGGSITIPYLNWVFDRDDLDKLIEKAKVMYGNQ